jgi:hypothetical protein
MNELRAAICTTAILLSAGCSFSQNPLSSLDAAVPDHDLYGVWVRKDLWGNHYTMIGPNPDKEGVPKGLLRIVEATDSKSQNAPLDVLALATTIGDSRYLSVIFGPEKTNKEAPDERAFVLCKYRVVDDTCEIFNLDGKFIREQIRTGKIKGDSSALTASTGELREWVEKNDTRIFTEKQVFRRMPLK